MTVSEYNQTVDKYSDNLYRFVLKNIKDEDKAKDIVQDTYIKFWEKKENVDVTKIKSYLTIQSVCVIDLDSMKTCLYLLDSVYGFRTSPNPSYALGSWHTTMHLRMNFLDSAMKLLTL